MVLNNISQMNELHKIHLYTNSMEHSNEKVLKFPIVNKPFVVVVENKNLLRVPLNGYYQIIYNDFYKGSGEFYIKDMSRSVILFYQKFNNQSKWTPITINSIFQIFLKDGLNYANIQLYI